MIDWSQVNHFTPDEAWGEVDRISPELIYMLDDFRDAIDRPVYVTFGTQGKHVAPWHGLGLAVDCVIDAGSSSKLNLIFAAMRFAFHGIGIYPKAKHPQCVDPLGFHFDMRYLYQKGIENILFRRWLAVPDPTTMILQHPLSEASLRKFGIL